MLFVKSAPSFVALQRPGAYGYITEYQFWILNVSEFVRPVESLGMRRCREFIFGSGPDIPNAPEEATFRGFLFRRRPAR